MILGVVIYLIYENTGIYLLINNNTSLIKKLEAKQYDDIDFKKVLEMIALQNNHEYDEFLLKVLQEKEIVDKPPCKKCISTIAVRSNAILNINNNKELPYLSYYNIYNQLARPNDIYNYPINDKYRNKLLELTKDTTKVNEAEILSIINEVNEMTIKKWKIIIHSKKNKAI